MVWIVGTNPRIVEFWYGCDNGLRVFQLIGNDDGVDEVDEVDDDDDDDDDVDEVDDIDDIDEIYDLDDIDDVDDLDDTVEFDDQDDDNGYYYCRWRRWWSQTNFHIPVGKGS